MSTLTLPLWIDLTPTGKTLVIIYPCGHMENITKAVIDKLGEPEAMGAIEDTECFFILFPHQNLPAELLDIAERMTSSTIIEALDKNIIIRETK